MEMLFFVLGAYLLGSIPTAYWIARLIRQIDLRRYGSGTLSGSMVYEHVGRGWVVPVGLFDIFKAALPTWLTLHAGFGEQAATLVGLAAAVGHNWPIFMGFYGGRGLSTFLGILVVLFPWGAAWVLGFLAVGFVLGDSAPFALASLVSMPLLMNRIHSGEDLLWLPWGMVIITLVKRLEANRRPLPEGEERWTVIIRRLLLDRDIADHQQWIRRHP